MIRLFARMMPSCRQVTEQASEYLDRELGTMPRLRFWMHLRACEVCAEFVRQIDLVRSGLGMMPAGKGLDPSVEESLVEAFRAQHGSEGEPSER